MCSDGGATTTVLLAHVCGDATSRVCGVVGEGAVRGSPCGLGLSCVWVIQM